MSLFESLITYKITKKSLAKLKNNGMLEHQLKSLSTLEDQFFSSAILLQNQLKKLPESAELLSKIELVKKYSSSYFRLDRWIKNKTIREWTEALIFALVVATIIRTFVVAPFKVPTGSMIPTIQIGDHIFATMFSYGIPIPFSDYKLFKKTVNRGEIIIFPYPRDPSIDYIKRVVGLEGDSVEIENDQVLINGKPLKEIYAFFDSTRFPQSDLPLSHLQFLQASPIRNFGPVTVPKGQLFVLGDNRYNSADGRYWGFVDIKSVKGRGQMVYWSHDPRKGLFDGYQLDRIFTFLK